MPSSIVFDTVFATSSPNLSFITFNLLDGVVLLCGSFKSSPFLFVTETILVLPFLSLPIINVS